MTSPALSRSAARLELRVQHLEDQLAIRELTAGYNQAFDEGRIEAWLDCFTDDAVFEITGAPPTIGRDRLRSLIEVIGTLGFVHHSLDHRVEVDGDTARQTCRLVLGYRDAQRAPDSSRWMNSGRYRDELVRTDAGWRFARRSFVPDAAFAGLPPW